MSYVAFKILTFFYFSFFSNYFNFFAKFLLGIKMNDFFPKKVYHCSCINLNIKLCLVKGDYSFKDICNKLNQVEGDKLYVSKCGDNLQDVVFSCIDHMALVVFSEKMCDDYSEFNKKTKDSCLRCIKKYLQTAYRCCYNYTDFNLPITIKKEKKTLCLCLRKF